MKFETMGLHPHLLQAVEQQGYAAPTPIQAAAIPAVLAEHDLLGCAQTGTGKTAAFALPVLHRLLLQPHVPQGPRQRPRPVRVLVLTPTRELATQVQKSFATYGAHTGLRQTVIYGGVGQHPQVRSLQAGTDIVIATPGRLLDLMNQGFVRLDKVQVLVLDEADQMLDMGFIHDLKRIVKHVPASRQTLMFSATMPPEIRQLSAQWLKQPKTIQSTPVASTPEKIKQSVAFVDRAKKSATLVHFLRTVEGQRHLVFCRTKRGADRLVKYLTQARIQAVAIHGDKSQNARERALQQFSSSRPPVLVATDVAARGLHMPGVSHVINYDLPETPEIYVHRIGRTARAGQSGESISLCCPDERPYLKRIEKLIKQAVAVQAFADQPAEPMTAAERPAPATRPTQAIADGRPAGRPKQRFRRPEQASHGTSRGGPRARKRRVK